MTNDASKQTDNDASDEHPLGKTHLNLTKCCAFTVQPICESLESQCLFRTRKWSSNAEVLSAIMTLSEAVPHPEQAGLQC